MPEKKSTPLGKDGGPSDRVEVSAAAPVEVPPMEDSVVTPVGVPAAASVEVPVVAVEVLAAAPGEVPPMEDSVVPPVGVPAAASVGVPVVEPMEDPVVAPMEDSVVAPVGVPAAASVEVPVVAVEVLAAAPVEVPPMEDSVVTPVGVPAAASVEVPVVAVDVPEVLAAAPGEVPPMEDSIVAPAGVPAAASVGVNAEEKSTPLGEDIKKSWESAFKEFMEVGPAPLIYRGPIDRAEVAAAAPAEDQVVAPVVAPVEVPAAAPVGTVAEIQQSAINQPGDENTHDEVQVVDPAGGVEVSAAAPVNAEIQPPVKIRRVGDVPRLPHNVADGNVMPAARENNNAINRGSEQALFDSDSVLRDFFARLPSSEVLEESGRKLDESIAGVKNMQQMIKNMCDSLNKTKQCMKSGAENAQKAGSIYNPTNADLSVCGTQLSNATSLLSEVKAGIAELPHLNVPAGIQSPPPPPITSEEEKERLARANAYASDHQLIRTGRSDSQNRYLTNLERVMLQEFQENVVRVVDTYDELPRHQRDYFNGLRERFSGSIDEYLLQGATLLASHESQVFTWDAYFLEDMEARSAKEHGETPEQLIKDYLKSVFPRE